MHVCVSLTLMHVCVSITGGAQQALVADRQTADSAYSNAASILSL